MLAAAPLLFVLIWSSGFIVARAVAPHAAPELLLAVRMALSAAVLGAAAALARERLPRGRRLAIHLLAGGLLNGVYLCTAWWAIQRGMPAGIMALLGALQPLVVAVASHGLLGERLAARAWAGLAIGLAGVGLALGWSVLGLSVGALSLLVWMTRHQGATRVSLLLLLVPPLAAIEAWILFGERLAPIQLCGFALALGGVLLARMKGRSRSAG